MNQEEAQTRMKELEQQIAELPVGSHQKNGEREDILLSALV